MANEGRIIKYFGQVFSPSTKKGALVDSGYSKTILGIALDWSVTSQSLTNNNSIINWSFKVIDVDSSSFDFDGPDLSIGNDRKLTSLAFSAPTKVTIDNTVVYNPTYGGGTVNIGGSIASGTLTIPHNADGTKTLSLSAEFFLNNVYDDEGYTCTMSGYPMRTTYTMSGSEVLEEITKKAIITSAQDFTDEGNPTITYNVPTGTVDVEAGILYSDGSIAVPYRSIPNTGSSYTFPLTDAERENLCKTVLGKGLTSTKVIFAIKSRSSYTNATFTEQFAGTKTLTIINYTPTIDPELWDFNQTTLALTGNKYKVVKYFSEVAYDIKAEGHKGADIAYISVKNGDRTNTTTGGTFDNIISSLFTFTATDTYGRRVSGDMELSPSNWVDYVKLTCNAKASEMSADGDVAITITGKYFKGSFGAVNNALIVSYTKEEFRGGAETIQVGELVPTMNGDDYTATFTIPDLDYKSSYNIVVHVSDKLMSAQSGSTVVAPTPIFDWGRTDFNFNVSVNVESDLTVAGNITAGGNTVPTIVSQGTSGNWTYRTWSDGVSECWGIVTLNTAITTAWGTMYVGTTKMSKVNYPTSLFNAKPVETVTVQSPTNAVWVFAESGSTGVNSSTTTGIYNICRPNQITAASNYYLSFYVKGRWK